MKKSVCVDNTKFNNWVIAHEPSDDMIYLEAWVRRISLMRDRIIPTFFEDYDIVGQHWSKSILNPVLKTLYKGVEIIWQYNFYDWQIMVKSPFPIKLKNLDWFNAQGTYLYYQGIPQEYQFKKYNYKTNNKEFAIDLNDDLLDVWAFALELKRAIESGESLLDRLLPKDILHMVKGNK